MKRFFLILMLGISLASASSAQADPTVSLEDDPIFSDSASDPTFTEGGGASADRDEGGTLEQAAEAFNVSCYQDLGPASACYEDYETQSCATTRSSCRLAGHYSR